MTINDIQDLHPPNFFERAFGHIPTPHVVVDSDGVVLYGNDQLHRLTGWSADESIGKNILDSIHPDDVGWIAEAFVQLAVVTGPDREALDRPWTPINFRMMDRAGCAIPVEVTGRSMLDDPIVAGMVYEVRVAWDREIFQRVLQGFAIGGSLESQFDLIIQLVSASAIEIDSAIVRFGADGRSEVIASIRPALRELLTDAAAADGLAAFGTAAPSPRFQPVAGLGGNLGAQLSGLGYSDAWHVDTPDLDGEVLSERYRIIAFTEVHHVPARGVIERLTRGAELASVVSVRSNAERRLDQAAHHDHLTGLPNRLGLHRHVAASHCAGPNGTIRGATLLFIDLDGFKAINDRCGHATGDIVLQVVARRLRAVTGQDGLVARFGGDEFAVVLDTIDGDAVAAYVERAVIALGDTLVVEGDVIDVSASIGRATLTSATDLAAAFAEADRVMYEAKRALGGSRPVSSGAPPGLRSGVGGLPR